MKRITKSLIVIVKVLLGVIAILAIFAIYQLIIYQVEGGIFVADKYTNPPASKIIYYRGQPLSEAVTSTRRVGNIDSSGERTYYQKPLMSWEEKWAYWNAIRKFPTLKKCLLADGQKTVDISKFNWGSMRTNTQVEVCLFHLAAQIKETQEIMAWAEEQGFIAHLYQSSHCYPLISRERQNCTRLLAVWRRTGKTIDSPYPFFSTQILLQQYHLLAILLGASGLPEWKIFMDEKQQAYWITIRNEPNK